MMDSGVALSEVMVALENWTASTNVNRIIIVQQQRYWRTSRTTHEATLFQRLVLGQRLCVCCTIWVDSDARCSDAGLNSNDMCEVQDCQVSVDKLTEVRRVSASSVERQKPQTDIEIPKIDADTQYINTSPSRCIATHMLTMDTLN